MGLVDRDYMRGAGNAPPRPTPWARIRFALWLFRKWLGGLFR